MWFSVVCTLIDNGTRHHSGQNVVMTRIVFDKRTHHAKPHSICFLPRYHISLLLFQRLSWLKSFIFCLLRNPDLSGKSHDTHKMSRKKNLPWIGCVRSIHIQKVATYPMWWTQWCSGYHVRLVLREEAGSNHARDTYQWLSFFHCF